MCSPAISSREALPFGRIPQSLGGNVAVFFMAGEGSAEYKNLLASHTGQMESAPVHYMDGSRNSQRLGSSFNLDPHLLWLAGGGRGIQRRVFDAPVSYSDL